MMQVLALDCGRIRCKRDEDWGSRLSRRVLYVFYFQLRRSSDDVSYAISRVSEYVPVFRKIVSSVGSRTEVMIGL